MMILMWVCLNERLWLKVYENAFIVLSLELCNFTKKAYILVINERNLCFAVVRMLLLNWMKNGVLYIRILLKLMTIGDLSQSLVLMTNLNRGPIDCGYHTRIARGLLEVGEKIRSSRLSFKETCVYVSCPLSFSVLIF